MVAKCLGTDSGFSEGRSNGHYVQSEAHVNGPPNSRFCCEHAAFLHPGRCDFADGMGRQLRFRKERSTGPPNLQIPGKRLRGAKCESLPASSFSLTGFGLAVFVPRARGYLVFQKRPGNRLSRTRSMSWRLPAGRPVAAVFSHWANAANFRSNGSDALTISVAVAAAVVGTALFRH